MTETPPLTDAERSGPDTATIVKLVGAAVLLAALVTFALQNTGEVDFQFLGWDFALPLIAVIVASAVIGTMAWRVAWLLRRQRG